MNILFFQNCISPHQMPYIKELPLMDGVDDVVVITPVSDLDERKEMGWNAQDEADSKVKIVVKPSLEDVGSLISKYSIEGQECWCLFSGINAFPEVAAWFRSSLDKNVKRGIITEPPYIFEHPLWQHAIRFALQDWKYVRYIDKFFVMGDEYLKYYKFWSKRWNVVPFMYCTEWRERKAKSPSCNELKVLYVGSLSVRKNVCILIDAVAKLTKDNQQKIKLGIVGDGEQRTMLEEKTEQANFITDCHFYGSKPMNEISAVMEQYDVLVLPSIHDGWGAVINEALTLGLYAVCSSNCGAKYLLKNEQNGLVFKSNDTNDLAAKLNCCISKMDWIRKTADDRIKWSKENISGKAVARYFLDNLMKRA